MWVALPLAFDNAIIPGTALVINTKHNACYNNRFKSCDTNGKFQFFTAGSAGFFGLQYKTNVIYIWAGICDNNPKGNHWILMSKKKKKQQNIELFKSAYNGCIFGVDVDGVIHSTTTKNINIMDGT